MGEAKRRADHGSGGGDTPRNIDRAFLTWLAAVYDRPVPADQRREVRRAFFSGGKAMLDIMAAATEASDEVGEAVADAVHAELRGFLDDLDRGEA